MSRLARPTQVGSARALGCRNEHVAAKTTAKAATTATAIARRRGESVVRGAPNSVAPGYVATAAAGMRPTTGTSAVSAHQPLRPVSCQRLMEIAAIIHTEAPSAGRTISGGTRPPSPVLPATASSGATAMNALTAMHIATTYVVRPIRPSRPKNSHPTDPGMDGIVWGAGGLTEPAISGSRATGGGVGTSVSEDAAASRSVPGPPRPAASMRAPRSAGASNGPIASALSGIGLRVREFMSATITTTRGHGSVAVNVVQTLRTVRSNVGRSPNSLTVGRRVAGRRDAWPGMSRYS